ncbi:MAG: YraN family protein [Ruminococcus sp.]|jgi:putative endonuclease|nr:YraN family protein [Ruminococcus sp.]
MDNYNKSLGKLGEDIVAQMLIKKGCKIIDRNFKRGGGEIDIIAEKGETVIFVEVKTRSPEAVEKYGEGVTAISPTKMKRIIKTASKWMYIKNCELQARFDIAELVIKNKKLTYFEYIADAFTLDNI